MDFGDLVVAGIPLLAIIIGLVEAAKQFGIRGRWSVLLALVLGLVLGAGYQISEVGWPQGLAGWFPVVIIGLGLGLAASGLYKAGMKWGRVTVVMVSGQHDNNDNERSR